VKRDLRKLLEDHDGPVVERAVRSVVDLLASPVEKPNLRPLVKKCECLRGTPPLQGLAGSWIWFNLVTPGMNPFPAMNSRTNFFSPALLSAVASSEQVVTRRHVPTSRGCEVTDIAVAGASVRVIAAEPELLAAATRGAKRRPVAKARRLRKRSLTWREYFARGHPKQAHKRSGRKAEGEGFEPSSDETARNGFRDRRIRPLCHPSAGALRPDGRVSAVSSRRDARMPRRRSRASPGGRRSTSRKSATKKKGAIRGKHGFPRTSEPAAQPLRTARRRRRDSNPRGRDFPHLTP
jgi:hypothetical protein